MAKKLCIHCRFYGPRQINEQLVEHACNHEGNNFVNPIDGSPNMVIDPHWLRELPREDFCGPHAHWFEQRQHEHPHAP